MTKRRPLSPNVGLCATISLALALGATTAHADEPAPVEYTIVSGGLSVKTPGGAHELTLPDCQAKAIARDGARVYVACGASGLLLLDATDPAAPKVASRIPTDGDAVALHTLNGKVWVELAHV